MDKTKEQQEKEPDHAIRIGDLILGSTDDSIKVLKQIALELFENEQIRNYLFLYEKTKSIKPDYAG